MMMELKTQNGGPDLCVRDEDADRVGDAIRVPWARIPPPLFRRALELEIAEAYRVGDSFGINWSLVSAETMPVVREAILARIGRKIISNLGSDAGHYERLDPAAGRALPAHLSAPSLRQQTVPASVPASVPMPPTTLSAEPPGAAEAAGLLAAAVRARFNRLPRRWRVGGPAALCVFAMVLVFRSL